MTIRHKPENPLERGMNHFYLYSKGHYQQHDLITDLQALVAARAGLKPEHVRPADMVNLLVEEVVTQWLNQPESPHRVTDFILRFRADLLRESPTNKPPDVDLLLITQCLGFLSNTKVSDGTRVLLEIGEADPTVLPLSNSNKSQTRKDRTTITERVRS